MTNPFDNSDELETTHSAPQVDETEVDTAGDVDVDTPELDETEELDEVTDAPKAAKGEKKAKEKKEPARPAAPEGFVSPVAFAKILTKHLEAKGASNSKGLITETNAIAPQQMYSTINSTKAGKNPFPVHSVGGRENMIVVEEGLAWWDEKDERKAQTAANAAAKEAKKADKAKKTAQAEVEEGEAGEDFTGTEDVVEAE